MRSAWFFFNLFPIVLLNPLSCYSENLQSGIFDIGKVRREREGCRQNICKMEILFLGVSITLKPTGRSFQAVEFWAKSQHIRKLCMLKLDPFVYSSRPNYHAICVCLCVYFSHFVFLPPFSVMSSCQSEAMMSQWRGPPAILSSLPPYSEIWYFETVQIKGIFSKTSPSYPIAI